MGSKYAEAEQRERQARIEEDIRQLFARYRQTGRKSEEAQRPQKARPAREVRARSGTDGYTPGLSGAIRPCRRRPCRASTRRSG